jgi:hypothetical protein
MLIESVEVVLDFDKVARKLVYDSVDVFTHETTHCLLDLDQHCFKNGLDLKHLRRLDKLILNFDH